jgi:hypothetical protein
MYIYSVESCVYLLSLIMCGVLYIKVVQNKEGKEIHLPITLSVLFHINYIHFFNMYMSDM